jgi:hypothetical protein
MNNYNFLFTSTPPFTVHILDSLSLFLSILKGLCVRALFFVNFFIKPINHCVKAQFNISYRAMITGMVFFGTDDHFIPFKQLPTRLE